MNILIGNNVIGEEIKRLRKVLSMSQKELAQGICCQTTISSIEKGRAYPSIEILYLLSLRLNVSMDYFLKLLATNNDLYTSEVIKNVEYFIKAKNYQEVLEITTFERKQRSKRNLGEKFNQFIDWHHYRASQIMGHITWQDCVKRLNDLLKSKEVYKIQFQDLKIKNVIANVLSENEQYAEAQVLYEDIIKCNIPIEKYQRFKLKAYFNLSKLHFYQENYKQSITVAKEGITLSLKLEDISVLGNLYLQAAQSMININIISEEIIDYLENAKFIYKLLNKKWHLQFISEILEPNIINNINDCQVLKGTEI